MSEKESWRADAAYDYVDALRPSELAWEFLRRNPDYRADYRRLAAIGRLSDEAATALAEQWGLRFRRRSRCFGDCPTDLLDPAGRPRRHRTDSGTSSRWCGIHC